MDLAKLVVAIGIAIFIASFVSDGVSLIYKPPTVDYTQCVFTTSSSSCSQIVTDICGTLSSNSANYSAYYRCSSDARNSQEYKDCQGSSGNNYQDCMDDARAGSKNYQLMILFIYGILGFIIMILGFIFIHYRSIGSGLILGGISVIIFSSFIAAYLSIMSSVGSLLTGSSTSQNTIQIIRLIFSAAAVTLLIVMSYLKLEKDDRYSHKDI